MPSSTCATDIIIMKMAILSFTMLSKYTLKRINYSMVSKKISGSYNKPHSKRVAIKNIFLYKKMFNFGGIFKTQSDQNMHQNAPNCPISSKCFRVSYAPSSLSTYVGKYTIIISI